MSPDTHVVDALDVKLSEPGDRISWEMRLQEAHWNLIVELEGAGTLECRPLPEWVQTVETLGNGREVLLYLIPVLETGTCTIRLTLTEGGPVTIQQLRLDTPGLPPYYVRPGELSAGTVEAGECDGDGE